MVGVWDVDNLADDIPYKILAEWDEYFAWKIQSVYYADTMTKSNSNSNRVLSDPAEISEFLGGLNGGS